MACVWVRWRETKQLVTGRPSPKDVTCLPPGSQHKRGRRLKKNKEEEEEEEEDQCEEEEGE